MIRLLCAAFLLNGLLAIPAKAQVDEYRVKAAFLLNFAKFVDWPAEAFHDPSTPIAICIAGRNPFGGALRSAVDGKSVAGRAFVVREGVEAGDSANCHILFVPGTDKARIRSVLSQSSSLPALSVGESDGFATDGGVVNFRLENATVRIEINAESARRKNLRISAKLMSLAKVVKP